MRILVTMPLNERQKARLVQEAPDAEFIFHVKSEVTREDLAGADIILGNLSDPKQLLFAENLKWIQLNNAGTEGYCCISTMRTRWKKTGNARAMWLWWREAVCSAWEWEISGVPFSGR